MIYFFIQIKHKNNNNRLTFHFVVNNLYLFIYDLLLC